MRKKNEPILSVKGPSAARNIGIEMARGKYIAFCDSDDTMKSHMLCSLVDVAEKYQCDVVICGYETFPHREEVLPGWTTGEALTPDQLIHSCKTIHSGNELCFSWRMLFRSDFLKDKRLKYDEQIGFGEDFLFNLSAVMEAQSIYVVPEPLYNYRIDNPNSIMRTKHKLDLERKIQSQYNKKKSLSVKYGLDKNNDWMTDMAYYYVTGFAGMLFRNALAAPDENKRKLVMRAISLSAISESYRNCGKKLYGDGKRQALFRLACKYKIMPIVMHYIDKWYQ